MKNHRIHKITLPDTALQERLSRELSISRALAQLLVNRGVTNIRQADRFLNVKLSHLLDPYSFSAMPAAVKLIQRALKNKERVLVFGDYDVDGLTALALVKNTLSEMGLVVEHYLPHRVREGYGLARNILQIARQKNIKLLITVDCGISNYDQIKELKNHDIDVIVTDHHEPMGSHLPPANSIINPKLESSNYPYRDLSGVGVAYKFCQAASDRALFEDLDLVCLGTVADVVPLTGENRIIAKEGLMRLAKTRRPGLKALIESSRIKNKKISSGYISYILGPRINASGRLDSAETALRLLMSRSEDESRRLAEAVEKDNRQRQKIENKILEEAQDIISRQINFKEDKVIVIAKEDWHQGVLGIVAAKLADRFYRPAVVISSGVGLCKGSARSIKNFHLFEALKECREFLESFGGHKHAAGLVIAKDKIGSFRARINRLANDRLRLEDLFPSLDIDMEVGLSDLNERLIAELELLEPFGAGNPEPLFYTRNLKLKGAPATLSRDTLKFWVTDRNCTCQAIGFGLAGLKDSLLNADSFDLAYTPRMDNWGGESSLILEVGDILFR